MKKFIVATDLDGTLFNSESSISEQDWETLQKLNSGRFIRILATGRSVYSAIKNLPPELPIDYLVSSSGAGIIKWDNKEVLQAFNMKTPEVRSAIQVLDQLKLDFSIQNKFPNNHYFVYRRYHKHNPDFERRLALYTSYSRSIQLEHYKAQEACQLIAITKGKDAVKYYNIVKESLPQLKVIRSTSPIDGESVWIEVYSKEVSKANGVAFIANKYRIPRQNILCIGNDFNDLDMLNWAQHAYVVKNAPSELLKQFNTVSSNNENGFTEAVNSWQKSLNLK